MYTEKGQQMALSKSFILFLLTVCVSMISNGMERQSTISAKKEVEASETEVETCLTYLTKNGLIDIIAGFSGQKNVKLIDYSAVHDDIKRTQRITIMGMLFSNLQDEKELVLQLVRLVDFCKAYDLPKIFAMNRAKGFSVLIDILFWLQNNHKTLMQVPSMGELKKLFEEARKGSTITIISGKLSMNAASPDLRADELDKLPHCTLPEEVAAFFPLFHAAFKGKFPTSESKLFMLDEELNGRYSQNTLSLLQQALFIIYRYYQRNPTESPHEEIDDYLGLQLSFYLEKESREVELALTEELLSLAHHFDLKILMNAILRVLDRMVREDEEVLVQELVRSLPLDYFPKLCGSPDTDPLMIYLLGEKLSQLSMSDSSERKGLVDIVSYCMESFMNTIDDSLRKSRLITMHLLDLNPFLEKQLKKKFLKKFVMHSFNRLYDLRDDKNFLNGNEPTSALRLDNRTLAYIRSENDVIVLDISAKPSWPRGNCMGWCSFMALNSVNVFSYKNFTEKENTTTHVTVLRPGVRPGERPVGRLAGAPGGKGP